MVFRCRKSADFQNCEEKLGVAHSLKELQARLRLFRSVHIGAVGFHQFIAHYGSAVEALAQLPKLYRGKEIALISEQETQEEWEKLTALGGKFLFHGDENYPKSLAFLPDAPPVLSILGNEELLLNDCVAMVGARNASINGCKIATQLAHDLAQMGYVVVTGFARGIDGAAQQAAVKQARAIGVLAGGINQIYPPQHEELYHETVRYGAMLSEMPIDYKAVASAFPRRNRIIAGLARIIVVVEAAKQSGSLITAQYGKKYNRAVCAMPGSPLDGRAQGGNHLIKQGAFLVETAEDVVAVLQQKNELFEQEELDFSNQHALDFESDDMVAVCEKLQGGLSASPTLFDDIIRHFQLSPAVVNAALLLLELEGKLHRFPGNKFSLK